MSAADTQKKSGVNFMSRHPLSPLPQPPPFPPQSRKIKLCSMTIVGNNSVFCVVGTDTMWMVLLSFFWGGERYVCAPQKRPKNKMQLSFLPFEIRFLPPSQKNSTKHLKKYYFVAFFLESVIATSGIFLKCILLLFSSLFPPPPSPAHSPFPADFIYFSCLNSLPR